MKFRTKLLLFNLSVIVGLTILTVGLGYDFIRQANLPGQRESLEKRAVAGIKQMARIVEIELTGIKPGPSIRKQVAGYRADTDLAFARVWDTEQKLIGSTGIGPSFRQVTDADPGRAHARGEGQITVWLPVERAGVRLGTVALGYSLDRIQSARRRVLLFVLTMSGAALLFVLASFFFSTKLTRPVNRMTDAFQRMAAGDLRQPPVPIESADEMGEMARAFNDMLATLRHIGKKAVQAAKGDLNITFTARGDLGNAFRAMILSQRKLVKQIAETAVQLTTAMTQFQANAEQQQRGAVEQSSAVEENRRTMDSLLESARQISETAQSVLSNAEKTQNNSGLMSERIAALSSHTQRIAEILQVIKEIANKSDLLALNAALEGTKAGEAGRGFSLVASQMQRLAENVMSSVSDIKELTDTITEATRATVLATEESTKLAADTTRSSRQIAMIVRQQQTGTEQVTKAMDDVAQVARETAVGSKEIVASAKDLSRLSEHLQALISQFATEDVPEERRERPERPATRQ